jgi:Holliday junction resolvase-like predicted endonuclease
MEEIRELKESQKKTDKQLEKTSKKVEEVSKKLGEMGIIDGKVGEDLFYRNVRHVFRQKDMAFSDVRRNVKKRGISGEYDIVAVGENRILVVEVKKRMEEDMIDDFLDRKLPKFRQIFPEYRDFPIIGGVGALVMPDSISRYAEKKGLYVLTQNGEGGAMLVNRQNFRAKEF